MRLSWIKRRIKTRKNFKTVKMPIWLIGFNCFFDEKFNEQEY